MSNTKSTPTSAWVQSVISKRVSGLMLGLGLVLAAVVQPVSADTTSGSVFHFLDRVTNKPVMQAEFPNEQVCATFQQMALEEPGLTDIPRCSSMLLDDQMPVFVVVRYADLGFSVNYRFGDFSDCEQFIREFTDAAREADIGDQISALDTACAE